ncbi:hypothetical protein Bca4012_088066 [Brassica carinata]
MCYYSLSSYSSTIKSDPIKLCLTALSVNLKSAKSASSIVSSLLKKVASSPEVPTILKDCLKEMKDTADELKQVFAEIINAGRISKGEIERKLETWESSAATDLIPCIKKFEEARENVEIKMVEKAVSELSMTTSNTLALMTRYLRKRGRSLDSSRREGINKYNAEELMITSLQCTEQPSRRHVYFAEDREEASDVI